jgi:hypothetical protein
MDATRSYKLYCQYGLNMRFPLLLFLGLLPLAAAAQVALEVNKPVQAHLEAGRADSHRIELKKDDYIEVLAKQTEVDVVLSLSGPDGKELQEANFLGVGGTELLIHLADVEGAYRWEVRAARQGSVGFYSLQLTAKRTAMEHDREVAAANSRFREIAGNANQPAEALEALAEKFRRLNLARRQAQALLIAGERRRQLYQFSEAVSTYEGPRRSSRTCPTSPGRALRFTTWV